jgi:DNA repair protein SbcC/Rad50
MQLHTIRLLNLNSLRGEWTISLDDGPLAGVGLFAITGDTGAGKTTILDAITLALFGKTNRKHEEEVRSYGTLHAQAEVEFSNEKGRFLARWQQTLLKRKTNPLQITRELAQWDEQQNWKIIATGQEMKSTSQRKGVIEQYLGLNYEQFKRTVLLAQGEFAAFLIADERSRSAVLERLTDAEIYSQLSQAAYLRAREAELELEQLRAQLQQRQLLSPEQVTALQAHREQWFNTLVQLRPSMVQAQKTAEQLRFWQQIQGQLSHFLSQQQQWQNETDEFAPSALLLHQHRQTLPLTGALTKWQQASDSLHEWHNQQAHWQLQQAQLTQALAQNQQQLTEATSVWEQYNQEMALRQPLWAAVEQLDTRLSTSSERLKFSTQVRDETAEKHQTARYQLEGHQQAIAELSIQLQQCDEWLQQHPNAAQLGLDLGLAEEKLNGLRQIARDLLAIQKNRSTHTAQLSEKDQLNRQAQAHLGEVQQQQAQLSQHWVVFAAELGETYRQMPPEQVSQRLQNRLKNIEDFERHFADYRLLLSDWSDLRDRQNDLSVAAEATLKLVFEAEDELEYALSTAKLKEARYLHERQRASWEQEREHLTEGEPCPLCGSVHHPYAHAADTKAFTDDAEREWQKAQQYLTEVQKRSTQLHAELRQLGHDMRQTESKLGHLLSEHVTDVTQEPNEKELILSQLQHNWTEDELPLVAQHEWLNTQMERTRQQYDKAQQLRQQIQDNATLLTNAERAALLAESAWREMSLLETRFDEEQTKCQATLQLAADDFDQLMAPHGVKFDEQGQFMPFFNQLKQIQQQFEAYQTRKQGLQVQIAGTQSALAQTQQLVQTSNQESELAELAFQTQLTDFQALKQERTALFGETSTADDQAFWQNKGEQLRDLREQSKAQWTETQLQLSAIGESLKQSERQIDQARTQQQQALAQLPQPNEPSADWPAQLLAQLLPTDEAERLTAKEQNLVQTGATLNAQVEQCRQQLQNCPDDWAEQLVNIQLQINELQAKIEECQREIGSMEQQLQQQTELEQQVAALLQQYEHQKADSEQWQHLRALIGSADGLVFRQFAQGLTLAQLVSLANRHLARLQGGRYRLHKSKHTDLELEMIDTFQADHIRSVNTLSGGETFLVSLALALGLADLTGRKTRVQSLFIDEGFGALDETALELAVSTLESLQAQGLTIGVISHIREMKERIQTQIRVIRQSDGFSRIEIG